MRSACHSSHCQRKIIVTVLHCISGFTYEIGCSCHVALGIIGIVVAVVRSVDARADSCPAHWEESEVEVLSLLVTVSRKSPVIVRLENFLIASKPPAVVIYSTTGGFFFYCPLSGTFSIHRNLLY